MISPHPPADRRCQIYRGNDDPQDAGLYRCINEGTHWEIWGGCFGEHSDDEECADDVMSWECGGEHRVQEEDHA